MTSAPTAAENHNDEYEFGSDIDDDVNIATSDYGSEFDAEEESLIGDLLAKIASTAPRERTVVYEDAEGNDGAEPKILVHSSPPSAVVRVQRGAAVELERRVSVEALGIDSDAERNCMLNTFHLPTLREYPLEVM